MDNEPDYANYTYEELLEVKSRIDKAQFPERYQKVTELLTHYDEKSGTCSEDLASHVDRYSTFWPRFGAALIDGILFAIILYVECLILGVEHSSEDKLLQALNGIQISIYFVVMHGLYGQTLGKMALGVKVVNHANEAQIDIQQALKRESVNLFLNILWTILILTVALDLSVNGEISQPLVYSSVIFGLMSVIWTLSEFITMLFNQKRRALHDFIGSTVVVRT